MKPVRKSNNYSIIYLQVPEAFAPKGSSMVTVVLSLSGSGRRTIYGVDEKKFQFEVAYKDIFSYFLLLVEGVSIWSINFHNLITF